MIKNYFKTAFRNLMRHRRHATINILGLGVALAACIVVFLVIQFEYNTDRHIKGYDNIYQVVTKYIDGGNEHFSPGVPFPAIKNLRQDYNQYQFAQLMQDYGVQITVKEKNNPASGAVKKFREETGIFYGEPELVQLFELNFLAGNASVLKEERKTILSRSMAEKYFGRWQDAIGGRIVNDNADFELEVAGVFEDVPANSDFPFKLVSSYAGFVATNGNGWPLEDWGSNTSNHQVYVKIPNGMNSAALDRELGLFEKKYNRDNKESKRTYFLQPLKNIHFDERLGTNGDHVSSKASLYTLALVGLLVILMACINFVNLSTALAVTRSKEVGIRKVMGSSKAQLSMQVLVETTTVVLVSVVVGIALAWLALPHIKQIMIVQDKLHLFNGGSLLFLLAITLFTIVLSGIYPAFIMGRFKPVEAIKNKINTSKVGSVSLRRVLVVLQFAFSQVFIIATIIVIMQMNFVKNADMGFNKESVLLLNMNADSVSQSRHEAFKQELMKRSDVKKVSIGFDAPSSQNNWSSNFAYDKMEDQDFSVQLKMGDADYAGLYNLEMMAGKFYSNSDTAREYVVNETLLKNVGVKNPNEAIGKLFRLGGGKPYPIVGVVKDFKQQSMRDAVVPIVMMPRKKFYQTVGIKLSSNNLGASSDQIKQLWDRYFPEYVHQAAFLDDDINRYYEHEDRLSRMCKVYALLAIFISCLGLYGLVSFMVVQKTKEVGIRKVLGASIQSIMYLFSKEFTILISVAFLLAAPAAWFLMNEWLKNFAFKIEPGVLVFSIAIIVSLLIAWATVGYKAFRAAVVNPVKSLRSE